MYPYGVVGNCQISALIGEFGSIDWLCLPRPDSPPVFGRLLDEKEGGSFSIVPCQPFRTEQKYLPNTNVLETTFTCGDGSGFRVLDFCPRFEQQDRMFRPMNLFRIVEPIRGTPHIQITCDPIVGWEKQKAVPNCGSTYVSYEIRGETLRIETNMSVTYFCENSPFALDQKIYFALSWNDKLHDGLAVISQDYFSRTVSYWRTWVKHCSIPALFQKETIRSALVLKLHCYEDTGAILAALTTSLPEEESQNRNWDYRHCWLRDSAFALSAFHNLGHFEEMEGFLKFLLNLGHEHEHSKDRLSPVYALDRQLPLPEREHVNWAGYKNSKPVRSNNQAAEHIQNDVYGEMILALAPIFFDERFQHLRTASHEALLAHLVKLSVKNISAADAGLWELRDGWQEHSFSNLMSWAGVERVTRIKKAGFLADLDEAELFKAKVKAEDAIRRAVVKGSLRNGPLDESYDAALLLLPVLRYPDSELNKNTVLQIASRLKLGSTPEQKSFLYRYDRRDDFGVPTSAFLLCSFWLVQALVLVGCQNEAAEIMKEAVRAANPLGLFSEHYSPILRKQSGNYPQAYSHVGLINAAFAVSPRWSEIL